MSGGASKAPLPQGPWKPVLLGPYTDLPLSHCPRVTGYLFTELSSGSSCCRNQEGRRRRSLPSSRISPPAPPPSPPPAKLRAAAQLCPPAPGRTKDGVVPNDLEMRGTVPIGHSSTWIRGLENCWLQALGGKGFIPASMALTRASTQGHFLIHPASRFTPKIDGKDIWLTGKGQRQPPTSHYPCILWDPTNCARSKVSRALKGRGTAEAPQRLFTESNALPGRPLWDQECRCSQSVGRENYGAVTSWLLQRKANLRVPQTPLTTAGALCSVAEVIKNWLLRNTYNSSKWMSTDRSVPEKWRHHRRVWLQRLFYGLRNDVGHLSAPPCQTAHFQDTVCLAPLQSLSMDIAFQEGGVLWAAVGRPLEAEPPSGTGQSC